MPLYEYECDDCKNIDEYLLGLDELPTCIKCNSSKMTKQISIFSSQFKGPGFYVNDYPKGNFVAGDNDCLNV